VWAEQTIKLGRDFVGLNGLLASLRSFTELRIKPLCISTFWTIEITPLYYTYLTVCR